MMNSIPPSLAKEATTDFFPQAWETVVDAIAGTWGSVILEFDNGPEGPWEEETRIMYGRFSCTIRIPASTTPPTKVTVNGVKGLTRLKGLLFPGPTYLEADTLDPEEHKAVMDHLDLQLVAENEYILIMEGQL